MLSINTNLSSLIAQSSLKSSTQLLNQAVERMSTGYKINGAKDNAANYSISTNMQTKINSYMIAEDNVSNGLNMLDTATGILEEINDRVTRLRTLQEHSMNNTYGIESREAINAEVNALIDEINRLYNTAEYNGIKLFLYSESDANGNQYYEQESYADADTTFAELQIGASSFNVYSQDGTLTQTYNTAETDTLGDFITTLQGEGFNANIQEGKITISSNDGKYITGDLADLLGIETKQTSFVESTEQSFNNQVPVTTESTTVITETTTTTTSTTNTTTIYTTTTVDMTSTRTEQTTTVMSTETVITDYTTTTTSTTQTSTIYTTATIETTTTTTTETIATVYTAQTETLLVPATAAVATFALNSPVPASEVSFIEPITRLDTSTMTALGSVDPNAALAEGTYSISTTEELLQLVEMTNSSKLTSSNYEFVLGDNIDLSTVGNWTPIGLVGYDAVSGSWGGSLFDGIFNGNGFTISNLTIDNFTSLDLEYVYSGLFAETGSDAVIKNLHLDNVNISDANSVGCIVGSNNGTIYNCRVTNAVIEESENENYGTYIGGIAGTSNGNISECYFSGNISTTTAETGGIVGLVEGYDITNCQVAGNIEGYSVGGIVGGFYGGNITNCNVSANISSDYYAGGVAAYLDMSVNIVSCQVSGTIDGGDAAGIGTYVGDGYGSDVSIDSCTINATITGNTTSGCVTYLGGQGVDSTLIISNTNVNSVSPDLDGVFVGDVSGEFYHTLIIKDSTYNSYYDTAGIPLYVGTPDPSSTITNVIPVTPTEPEEPDEPEEPVTPTLPATYTTATLDTTFGELGLDPDCTGMIKINGVFYPATHLMTISDMIERINADEATSGSHAELIDGVLTITGEYPVDPISTFLGFFPMSQSTNTVTNTITTTQTIMVDKVTETPVTETIWTTTTTSTTRTETITTTQTIDVTITETIPIEKVTETPVTETVWVTTTSETTRTETLTTTSTISASGATTFEELGVSTPLRVTVFADGTKNILDFDKDTTLDDFYLSLSSMLITTTTSGNVVTFTGQGNSYIDSDNLKNLLGLSAVDYTMGSKTSNTQSSNLFAIEKVYGVYAPGQISLQVGINGDNTSQIVMDVSVNLRGINNLRGIGEDLDTDYLKMIDDLLATLSEKQTQFGAISNRLISALDEISIQYENLVSSRSTIRDADMAKESASYIQQQILQQASATLLATANQSPAIALQLI